MHRCGTRGVAQYTARSLWKEKQRAVRSVLVTAKVGWEDGEFDIVPIKKGYGKKKGKGNVVAENARRKGANKPRWMQRAEAAEEREELSTADMDVYPDNMYDRLGEPLDDTHHEEMWHHAAGYDMGITRSVPIGPLVIRPIPENVRVSFTDGVVEWKNALMIPVNMGGNASRRGNQFLEGGSKISWFPAPSHLDDARLLRRLVPTGEGEREGEGEDPQEEAEDGEGEGADVPIFLYCRSDKRLPYVFCGEVGDGVLVDGQKNKPMLIWTLFDYDELVEGSEHFRNLVLFSDLGI